MGFHENFMSWSFMWFHNGPSLCAGGGAPNFAFGPAASALRTAPYQRLELPPDAEASEASEAASEAARTVVILAFRDAGDEKRGGWPPDSIQHRDETSRGVGWNVGESCGNRERNGDIWPVFFSAINQLSMIYYSWISWENHLGNQLADISKTTNRCTWWHFGTGKMMEHDRLWGRP